MSDKPNIIRARFDDPGQYAEYDTRVPVSEAFVVGLRASEGIATAELKHRYSVGVWRSEAYDWDEIDAVVRSVLDGDAV